MIEIILTVFLTSMTLTWTVGTLYYHLRIKRQFDGTTLAILNQNLRKLDLYWSIKNSNFQAWGETAVARDRRGLTKSLFAMIGILSFLSFPGFVLLNLILFVGYSRKEARVFASDLAKQPNLEPAQVRELVSSLG